MPTSTNEAPVVIVGAGPGGMTLAFQLVANGIPVRVLERSSAFDREFRGEWLQPSVLPILRDLGIRNDLEAQGAMELRQRIDLYIDKKLTLTMKATERRGIGATMSQPRYLAYLDEQCRTFTHYQFDFNTAVNDFLWDGDRVIGVKAKREDGTEEEIEARFCVVASGRRSTLRKVANMERATDSTDCDLLWSSLPLGPETQPYESSLNIFYGHRGSAFIFYRTSDDRLQTAWQSTPDEDLVKVSHDPRSYTDLLMTDVPEDLRPLLQRELAADTTQAQGSASKTRWVVLRALSDHLESWHRPGLLFIGDAAHTMSPTGGQGVNMSIRDSVVTANHIVERVKRGAELDGAMSATIEAERRPEVTASQKFQLRSEHMEENWSANRRRVVLRLGQIMGSLAPWIWRFGILNTKQVLNGVTKVEVRTIPGSLP